jgi:hypothetical protein
MRHSDGTRPRVRSNTRYGSLSSFYLADERRMRSRERDVGLWWRDDLDGPLHRAAWVAETGELYLVRLGSPDAAGGDVEVLAIVADRARLDRALTGWRERCGERRSLGWLRARAATLAGARAAGTRRANSATRGDRRLARDGRMAAAMSSVASELSYRSKQRARRSARSRSPATARLAPPAPVSS